MIYADSFVLLLISIPIEIYQRKGKQQFFGKK